MHDSLDLKTITDLFSQFDKGEILAPPQQFKGDVDLNYKIVADSGIYLLKYIVNIHALEQFEFFGTLHDYLHDHGIRVPLFYTSRSGSYVSNNTVLMQFIDGAVVKEWNEKQIASLVDHFAAMLLVLKDYPVPDFVKNKDDKYIRGSHLEYCYEVYRPRILKLSGPDDVLKDVVMVIDMLYSIRDDFNALPKQIIHGDLNEMNALFRGDENVAIIDFGLSYNPVVYDLGVHLYWYALPWWSHEFQTERYNLILERFTKQIPLSSTELRLLPYMMLRRGMMDLMLTLEWYWAQPEETELPTNRLRELTERNATIMGKLL
jgi:Ser/Thr protein kinase RdoA (MazF antagonist)